MDLGGVSSRPFQLFRLMVTGRLRIPWASIATGTTPSTKVQRQVVKEILGSLDPVLMVPIEHPPQDGKCCTHVSDGPWRMSRMTSAPPGPAELTDAALGHLLPPPTARKSLDPSGSRCFCLSNSSKRHSA